MHITIAGDIPGIPGGDIEAEQWDPLWLWAPGICTAESGRSQAGLSRVKRVCVCVCVAILTVSYQIDNAMR